MPRKPGEKILEQEHKERVRAYNKARPARHELYNTTRWRKLRELKMSLSPLCEQCEREGRITAGELVDHIIPIEDGGAKFALENLQTLCRACHNRKHSDSNRGGAVKKSREF